jgi:rare lipoprotein A
MRMPLLCALALVLAAWSADARTITGIASWYGPGFAGRRMANGRPFRTLGESGAMLSVPLGSIVKVTNLENGRWMWLRITDRGPYIRGRVLDLSLAAASELGMVTRGVARVRVETSPRQPAVRRFAKANVHKKR